jgi:uncharacterized DUF497 family protein
MRISFDPNKSSKNAIERGLPFDVVSEFDFSSALFTKDERRAYAETRYVALGLLHGRLHVLCFTETGDGIRVISFRKANDREVRAYAKVKTIVE